MPTVRRLRHGWYRRSRGRWTRVLRRSLSRGGPSGGRLLAAGGLRNHRVEASHFPRSPRTIHRSRGNLTRGSVPRGPSDPTPSILSQNPWTVGPCRMRIASGPRLGRHRDTSRATSMRASRQAGGSGERTVRRRVLWGQRVLRSRRLPIQGGAVLENRSKRGNLPRTAEPPFRRRITRDSATRLTPGRCPGETPLPTLRSPRILRRKTAGSRAWRTSPLTPACTHRCGPATGKTQDPAPERNRHTGKLPPVTEYRTIVPCQSGAENPRHPPSIRQSRRP
jgi:hypothetical protein